MIPHPDAHPRDTAPRLAEAAWDAVSCDVSQVAHEACAVLRLVVPPRLSRTPAQRHDAGLVAKNTVEDEQYHLASALVSALHQLERPGDVPGPEAMAHAVADLMAPPPGVVPLVRAAPLPQSSAEPLGPERPGQPTVLTPATEEALRALEAANPLLGALPRAAGARRPEMSLGAARYDKGVCVDDVAAVQTLLDGLADAARAEAAAQGRVHVTLATAGSAATDTGQAALAAALRAHAGGLAEWVLPVCRVRRVADGQCDVQEQHLRLLEASLTAEAWRRTQEAYAQGREGRMETAALETPDTPLAGPSAPLAELAHADPHASLMLGLWAALALVHLRNVCGALGRFDLAAAPLLPDCAPPGGRQTPSRGPVAKAWQTAARAVSGLQRCQRALMLRRDELETRLLGLGHAAAQAPEQAADCEDEARGVLAQLVGLEDRFQGAVLRARARLWTAYGRMLRQPALAHVMGGHWAYYGPRLALAGGDDGAALPLPLPKAAPGPLGAAHPLLRLEEAVARATPQLHLDTRTLPHYMAVCSLLAPCPANLLAQARLQVVAQERAPAHLRAPSAAADRLRNDLLGCGWLAPGLQSWPPRAPEALPPLRSAAPSLLQRTASALLARLGMRRAPRAGRHQWSALVDAEGPTLQGTAGAPPSPTAHTVFWAGPLPDDLRGQRRQRAADVMVRRLAGQRAAARDHDHAVPGGGGLAAAVYRLSELERDLARVGFYAAPARFARRGYLFVVDEMLPTDAAASALLPLCARTFQLAQPGVLPETHAAFVAHDDDDDNDDLGSASQGPFVLDDGEQSPYDDPADAVYDTDDSLDDLGLLGRS